MTPRARSRLISIIIVVLGLSLAASLALYGLSGKITYFQTPSDVKAGTAPSSSFRLGGMVKQGSVRQDGEMHYFTVTDFANDLNVAYRGILPDLFREGQGIVATGTYDTKTHVFNANQILAKHDENYMPPDVKKAMDRQQPKQ
jgi:cytochrome c-type biogenesis protein CcmE